MARREPVSALEPGEVALVDYARDRDIGAQGLRDAMKRGQIKGRKVPAVNGGAIILIDSTSADEYVVESKNNVGRPRKKKPAFTFELDGSSGSDGDSTDSESDEDESDVDPVEQYIALMEEAIRRLKRSMREHDRIVRKEAVRSVAESLLSS